MDSLLRIARVVASHPEAHAVDLVFLDDGGRAPLVQVLTPFGSTNSGVTDLCSPITTGDKWDAEAGERDLLAVVGWMKGIPIVLGFLFPQVAQCLFADKNRSIHRHASDVYTTIDNDGNTELYHPSGTYLRIGTAAAHDDLTGKDFDKKWAISKNTTKSVHVQLTVKNAGVQKASLNIDPSGNVELAHAGNLTTNTGGSLSATVGGTTTVDSTGNLSITAPTITLNGNTIVNGPLTQGHGAAGGGCSMLGPLVVQNDVTATGTSLHTHTHPGDSGGTTGQPN